METVKKSNHQANIVRIFDIKKHGNADSLEIITVGGYQAISRIGTFKVGDLAVYIQPDSVVPQTEPFIFIWGPYQASVGDAVPERRRRITTKKLRGEWSEGLLMPLSDFASELLSDKAPIDFVIPGNDVSDLLGITHYDPDAGRENTRGESTKGPRRRYPKTVKGWFFFVLHKLGFSKHRVLSEEVDFSLPVYDVEALKNNKRAFQQGERVVVTEKIHGSNARFVFLDGKMYAGSRTLWKSAQSNCVWRKALTDNPWIEEWCRENPEYALYGEVTPTQKGFDYGSTGKDSKVRFFVFDIRKPNGTWATWTEFDYMTYPGTSVPVFYAGPYQDTIVASFVDGPSTVPGAKHIREGIVVKAQDNSTVAGLGRKILKVVSNVFLEKDNK